MRGPAKAKHWTRGSAGQTRPKRAALNIYRTSDNSSRGVVGVPLAAAEDAMVAAVRMAYRIADAQIDRSTALANRLKGAGDRATGGDSGREAIDSAGRLVNNAMLSGMSWIEALASSDDSLGSRLVAAQLKAVQGVLFGRSRGAAAEREPPARAEDSRSAPPEPPSVPAEAAASIRNVRVVLKDRPEQRRAVRVVLWDLPEDVPADLYFSCARDPGLDVRLVGKLLVGGDGAGRTLVMLGVPPSAPSGIWRAAACNRDDVQLGIIEIEI